MDEFVNRTKFIKSIEERYCKDCDGRKGMKNGKHKILYEIGSAVCKSCGIMDMMSELEDFPSEAVIPFSECEKCGERTATAIKTLQEKIHTAFTIALGLKE